MTSEMKELGWTNLEEDGITWDKVKQVIWEIAGRAGGAGVGLMNACMSKNITINKFASMTDEEIKEKIRTIGDSKIAYFNTAVRVIKVVQKFNTL